MTLNKAINNKLIKINDVVRLTSEDKDVIVKVSKISLTSMHSVDIKIISGYCGNITGNRGFYVDDKKPHEFRQVDKIKYPEYFL